MAHRIDTSTAQKDKFGVGKNGFTRGNPQTGVPATELDDDYFDMLQEEIVGIVEAAGDTLDKTKRNQLNAALGKLFQNKTGASSALGALVPAANRLPYFTGANGASLTDLTSVGRDILALATKTAVLEYLGLGALSSAGVISGSLDENGYLIFPTIIDGEKRNFIIQWGRTATLSTGVQVTLPTAFPTKMCFLSGCESGAYASIKVVAVIPVGLGAIGVYGRAAGASTLANTTVRWIVGGY